MLWKHSTHSHRNIFCSARNRICGVRVTHGVFDSGFRMSMLMYTRTRRLLGLTANQILISPEILLVLLLKQIWNCLIRMILRLEQINVPEKISSLLFFLKLRRIYPLRFNFFDIVHEIKKSSHRFVIRFMSVQSIFRTNSGVTRLAISLTRKQRSHGRLWIYGARIWLFFARCVSLAICVETFDGSFIRLKSWFPCH